MSEFAVSVLLTRFSAKQFATLNPVANSTTEANELEGQLLWCVVR